MNNYIQLNIENIEKYKNFKSYHKDRLIFFFEKFGFLKNYIISYYISGDGSFVMYFKSKKIIISINLYDSYFTYHSTYKQDYKLNYLKRSYDDIIHVLYYTVLSKCFMKEIRKYKILNML